MFIMWLFVPGLLSCSSYQLILSILHQCLPRGAILKQASPTASDVLPRCSNIHVPPHLRIAAIDDIH